MTAYNPVETRLKAKGQGDGAHMRRCLRCDEMRAETQFATYTMRGKQYRRHWCRPCYAAHVRAADRERRQRLAARKIAEGDAAWLERRRARGRAAYARQVADPEKRARRNARTQEINAYRTLTDPAYRARRQERRKAEWQRIKDDPVVHETRNARRRVRKEAKS